MGTNPNESRGLKTVFEKEPCGRCGGSGSYSYNRMHGSVCYGCQGKGERLTKRGKAASAYLRELLTKTTKELKVGDRIRVTQHALNGMSSISYWGEVTCIEREEKSRVSHKVNGEWVQQAPGLKITTSHSKVGETVHIYGDDAKWVTRPEHDQHVRLTQEAVKFQSTLTKAGKPSKRRISR